MSFIPAWADAFIPERIAPGPPLGLPAEITREWAYGDGEAAGVRVAVVDSGIEADHPAVGGVAGGVVVEADPSNPDGCRLVEGPHDDLFGHGTACAGLIRQVARGVDLYSVRVLGSRLTGRAYVFARGIEWCLDNGIDVINLSMSTTNDDWYARLHALCDEAAYAGVCVVAALNNEHKPSYPSEFSSVFSVAAMAGKDHERIAVNPRPPAEWGAAGIDLRVPWLHGRALVSTGNSFAAAVMTGHVARVVGAHPGLLPWQVKTILSGVAVNR